MVLVAAGLAGLVAGFGADVVAVGFGALVAAGLGALVADGFGAVPEAAGLAVVEVAAGFGAEVEAAGLAVVAAGFAPVGGDFAAVVAVVVAGFVSFAPVVGLAAGWPPAAGGASLPGYPAFSAFCLCGLPKSNTVSFGRIFVTTPAAMVFPPSRRANRAPW